MHESFNLCFDSQMAFFRNLLWCYIFRYVALTNAHTRANLLRSGDGNFMTSAKISC